MPSQEDVNRLMADLKAGKSGAEEALMPLLYDELRALARHYMRGERADHTLQTTALVHEAYLKLGGTREGSWNNKAHFMRVAARAMRLVLIDHARGKRSVKKGGQWTREPLDEALKIMEDVSFDLLAVDSALSRLNEIDKQMSEVVELRFFAGLTIEETAEVMGISQSTVKNEWVLAKAWLRQQME